MRPLWWGRCSGGVPVAEHQREANALYWRGRRHWCRKASSDMMLACATIAFFDPLCQPEVVELVHADPADAEALRDLHLLTWEVTYRPHAPEAWYCERLAAHS